MTAERVGSRYRGPEGAGYFAWQREVGALGARLNRFKFLPHVGEDDVVLDFGCGGGALLAGLPAHRRIGVEPSPEARSDAQRRGLEVHASAAEVAPGSIDVVISNHALEHALSPFDELVALRAALRPGGRLVLWLPIDDWRSERRPDPDDRNGHLHTWTPLLLSNLLAEAGYEVLDCRVVTHAWPPRTALAERLLPQPLFDLAARAWAVLRRRRQVTALARRPA